MPDHYNLGSTPTQSGGATIDDASRGDTGNCARCGYVLFGLADQQNCPECAFPVAASRQGPWLRFADPRWLYRLTVGAMLVVPTMAVLSFAPLIWYLPRIDDVYIRFALSIIFILDLAGFWLLTDPDPSGVGDEISRFMRSTLRLALFASFGIFVLSIVYLHILNLGFDRGYLPIVAIGLVVDWIAIFLRMTVLGCLAARIPDMDDQRRANILRFVLTIPFALVELDHFLPYFQAMTTGVITVVIPTWLKITGCISLVIAWFLLVSFLIRNAYSLWRAYRNATNIRGTT